MELFKEYAFPALLSFFSAFLATKLAFSKYKSEKRWDEKKEKYALVIESVEYVVAFYNSQHLNTTSITKFNNNDEELNSSMRAIQKYAAIGKLYFSKEFAKVLYSFHTELDNKLYNLQERYECANGNKEEEFRIELQYHASVSNHALTTLHKLLKIADKDLIK